MKFKVTGQNRDTGARMVLEFEAESKAAAERKAMNTGMSVTRVEDISDGYVGKAMDEPTGSRRRSSGRRGGGRMLLFVVIIAAIAVYYFWAKIKPMLPAPK